MRAVSRVIIVSLATNLIGIGPALAQSETRPQTTPQMQQETEKKAQPARDDSTSPSVDKILDLFVNALGGRAALESVKSIVFTGTLNVDTLKEPGKTTEYFEAPNHFAFVAEIPNYGTARTIYDGKTAWNVDRKGTVTEISGPQLLDISRRSDIHWDLKLKEFYPGLKVVGSEKVNGKDAWVLESTAQAWTFRLFFDADSGLLVRFDTDTHELNGKSSVLIGDYRQVGNVRFAFTAKMTTLKGGWSRLLSEVKFNVPIAASVFIKPSSTTDSDGAAKEKHQE